MRSILVKDLRIHFSCVSTWLFIAGFVCSLGFSFAEVLGQAGLSEFSPMASVQLLLFPLVSLRAFSMERRTGMYALLVSSPVSTFSIVLAKFLACMAVFAVALGISICYPILLQLTGGVYILEAAACYLGALLLGACFLSLGLFLASMPDRPLHAWFFTAAALFFLKLMDMIMPFSDSGTLQSLLSVFGLFACFRNFEMGILSLSSLAYMVSFTLFFLFMTCKVINKRKWGKGDQI